MSELAWTLTATIVGIAIVGAVWRTIVRNTMAAILLATGTSFALWWYPTAQDDPFWPIAAYTVVSIIVAVSIAIGMLARAARRADGRGD